MIARLRLLLAILVLALASVPAFATAAMAEECGVCDHCCNDMGGMDHSGGGFDCAAECLFHAAVPVLMAPSAPLPAIAAAAVLDQPIPETQVRADASWPPPLRPPRS